MKPSPPSHIPAIHPLRTPYSFFLVSKKSAHNSIWFYLCSFFNPQSAILNPKSPHSFRGKCEKSDFYSSASFSPPQMHFIWGGVGGGVSPLPTCTSSGEGPGVGFPLSREATCPRRGSRRGKCALHLGRAGWGWERIFVPFRSAERILVPASGCPIAVSSFFNHELRIPIYDYRLPNPHSLLSALFSLISSLKP